MKNKHQSKTPASTKIAAFSMLALLVLGVIYFLSVAFGHKDNITGAG